MQRRSRKARPKPPLEYSILYTATLCLIAAGAVMVYSASSASSLLGKTGDPTYYLKRYVVYAVLGLVAMHVVSRRGLAPARRLTGLLLVTAFGLTLAVMVPGIGRTVNGATRWLAAGPVQFQPSELLKIALVLYSAQLLAGLPKRVRTLGRVSMLAALYGMIGYAGFRAAKLAKDRYAKLLAAGLTGLILAQAVLNFFAVMGMAPLTGVPLPFVSYGNSNLIVLLGAMGLLLGVAATGGQAAAGLRAIDGGREAADAAGRSPSRLSDYPAGSSPSGRGAAPRSHRGGRNGGARRAGARDR